MKKPLVLLALLALIAVFVVACGGTGSATPDAPNTVHANETQFVQNTITIKKGESLTIVNDVAVVHILQNGSWDSNGNAKAGAEAGAPKVEVQLAGNDKQTVGPFTTAGTFKIYCTVHPGMNLTVNVQ